GIRNIARVVMTRNHFVIGGVRLSLKAEWTELDKLRAENRLLKAEVKRNEMEVAFAKKLIEIRNREAKSSSNNKPSKN
ncbi:hypothetical protein L0O81_16630, partial [Oliverpabstia sp. DFI.9.49]|nr:hypothetical protein [Oliverpabstia sp. DFI.9.49]